MDIALEHTGEYSNGSSKSIILHIDNYCSKELTTITGEVREDVLNQLKEVVSELEQQNQLIKNS